MNSKTKMMAQTSEQVVSDLSETVLDHEMGNLVQDAGIKYVRDPTEHAQEEFHKNKGNQSLQVLTRSCENVSHKDHYFTHRDIPRSLLLDSDSSSACGSNTKCHYQRNIAFASEVESTTSQHLETSTISDISGKIIDDIFKDSSNPNRWPHCSKKRSIDSDSDSATSVAENKTIAPERFAMSAVNNYPEEIVAEIFMDAPEPDRKPNFSRCRGMAEAPDPFKSIEEDFEKLYISFLTEPVHSSPSFPASPALMTNNLRNLSTKKHGDNELSNSATAAMIANLKNPFSKKHTYESAVSASLFSIPSVLGTKNFRNSHDKEKPDSNYDDHMQFSSITNCENVFNTHRETTESVKRHIPLSPTKFLSPYDSEAKFENLKNSVPIAQKDNVRYENFKRLHQLRMGSLHATKLADQPSDVSSMTNLNFAKMENPSEFNLYKPSITTERSRLGESSKMALGFTASTKRKQDHLENSSKIHSSKMDENQYNRMPESTKLSTTSILGLNVTNFKEPSCLAFLKPSTSTERRSYVTESSQTLSECDDKSVKDVLESYEKNKSEVVSTKLTMSTKVSKNFRKRKPSSEDVAKESVSNMKLQRFYAK